MDKKKLNEESIILERDLRGKIGLIFIGLAAISTIFHIYILNFHALDPWIFRSIHLTIGLVLGFAYFPGSKKTGSPYLSWIDWLLIAISISILAYIVIFHDQLVFRSGVNPTQLDFIIALIGTFLIIEITRRAAGWSLPILSLVFILYALLGPYMPGILNHGGYSLDRFFSYIYGLSGIFGVTLDVSSRYLILFITFGAFLQASKVGNYFMDLSFSVAGRYRGGPAKIAVVSSGLMGMMSGSSAANVATTGTLTIPLMKKVGYSPRFAAATEATASYGGQLMPPIMGAGAFLMAEIIAVPYTTIALVAIIPAVLFYIAVYLQIDIQALKQGIKGLEKDKLPRFSKLLKSSYLIIPIIILIGSLLMGYSIIRSGTVAILACFVLSWFSKKNRMGWRATLEGLQNGTKNSIQIIAVCACAGIIVGVISLTGVGAKFSNILLAIADQNQFLALLFAMIITIILGMGMPTTAAYAIAASIIAPGLIQLGIEPLVAHFFVFYFATMSAITPPVALAAYAGAGISGSNPMKTAVTAFTIGSVALVLPFLFVYNPAILLIGTASEVLFAVVKSLFVVTTLVFALQGYIRGKLNKLLRTILFISILLLISPNWVMDIIGFFLVLFTIIMSLFFFKKKTNDLEEAKVSNVT